MTDQEAQNVANQVLHLLTQRGKDAESWRAQSDQWEAQCKRLREEKDRLERQLGEAHAQLRVVEQDAQALMRPQGEWEAHVESVKQAVYDALESVDRERRDGAQFENILLAVSARIALAWLDLNTPRVSSTEVKHEPAQSEETQLGGVAALAAGEIEQ